MALTLSAHFASMDLPSEMDLEVVDADSFLTAFVNGCDTRGRYPWNLLFRLFWWHRPVPSADVIDGWVNELLDGELLKIGSTYLDIYGGSEIRVLHLLKKGRYPRFVERPPIPKELREAVYRRDGHRCVSCGGRERLTLDHIHPYSMGGEDTFENLQTMCVWCNSRKGATV